MISAVADQSNDLLIDRMTVLSDDCQPVEAAAGGGDAGHGYATPGGHDGPTGIDLGAVAFACRVLTDARSFHIALL